MVIIPMNDWSRSRDSLASGVANGPRPRSVPQSAMAEKMKEAVMAPRWSNRKEAHKSGRIAKYSNGAFLPPNGVRPKNTSWATAKRTRSKTPGKSRYPRKGRKARAIPVGGQTAEALGFILAHERPNLPAAK